MPHLPIPCLYHAIIILVRVVEIIYFKFILVLCSGPSAPHSLHHMPHLYIPCLYKHIASSSWYLIYLSKVLPSAVLRTAWPSLREGGGRLWHMPHLPIPCLYHAIIILVGVVEIIYFKFILVLCSGPSAPRSLQHMPHLYIACLYKHIANFHVCISISLIAADI